MIFLKKFIGLFILISLFFLAGFLAFGDQLEFVFSQEKLTTLFSGMKNSGWLAGILLLISDIVLPIPATGIMAALGATYGVWAGGVFSSIGSICAGLLGYFMARFFDKKYSRWIASETEMAELKTFFDLWGGYAIIISRFLPIMPEAITLMAGFANMKFPRFFIALIAGSIPISFLFASIGVYANIFPGSGIALAILIPAIVWPFIVKIVKI